MKRQATVANSRSLLWAAPLCWLALFTLAPCLIVLAVSFAKARTAVPPYAPLLIWQDGILPHLNATLENYVALVSDSVYAASLWNSIRIAATAATLTLVAGYPAAYAIARARPSLRTVLIVLVILPFWTSFLIRVYAWVNILNSNGFVNEFLLGAGIIAHPIPLLHTEFAIHIGIVYSYYPLMVFPIYVVLERFDWRLLEAAADLGARPYSAFLRVTLPSSFHGVFAGFLLVFIPCLGEFVIPDLLGGSDTLMLGRILWTEFFNNHDWPLASAIAAALMLLVLLPAVAAYRFISRAE